MLPQHGKCPKVGKIDLLPKFHSATMCNKNIEDFQLIRYLGFLSQYQRKLSKVGKIDLI